MPETAPRQFVTASQAARWYELQRQYRDPGYHLAEAERRRLAFFVWYWTERRPYPEDA